MDARNKLTALRDSQRKVMDDLTAIIESGTGGFALDDPQPDDGAGILHPCISD